MVKGRPRQFDIDEALDKALLLFWRHGYEGVSVSVLAETMGINVPSLYAAFGSKEELFFKAVGRYCESARNIYLESFKKKTAYGVVKAILEQEIDFVTQKNKPHGCLMVQGALVSSPESDSICQKMAEMRGAAEGWMADRFRQAQKDGDLPGSVNARALACYVMTLNSGIALQAKSGVDRKRLKAMIRIALENWPRSKTKKQD